MYEKSKHKSFVRWTHWLNVPLLFLMIWSGLLIYWANDIYEIKVGGMTIFPFFPEKFYLFFGLDHRLAEGMAWHFFVQWFFVANGLVYVFFMAVSGEWRHLALTLRTFKDAGIVVLYELGLVKNKPESKGKYNAAQRIAYAGIIICGVGSTITGYAIYKPVQLSFLTSILGGYEFARVLHFGLTVIFVLFTLIHVVQVIRAGFSKFSAMVTGHENEK